MDVDCVIKACILKAEPKTNGSKNIKIAWEYGGTIYQLHKSVYIH
jgi:hypothetical protein